MKPNILKNHPHTEQQNHIIAIKTLRNRNYGKAKLTVATIYKSTAMLTLAIFSRSYKSPNDQSPIIS